MMFVKVRLVSEALPGVKSKVKWLDGASCKKEALSWCYSSTIQFTSLALLMEDSLRKCLISPVISILVNSNTLQESPSKTQI
jgi:hypothetical protein